MNYIKRIIVSFFIGLIALTGWGQQDNGEEALMVSGKVFDAATLEPIAFAEVSCRNFSSGFSDMDGSFSITVPSYEDVLTFRFTGFHPTEVVLAGRNEVEVYLTRRLRKSFQHEANLNIYAQKEAYTPRSLSSSSMVDDHSITGEISPENVFGSFVSGLRVNKRSGITGVGSDMFLRGFSSLNATNRPLVIVDGMIYETQNEGNSMIGGREANPLAGINLNDIENVTVLKDAASLYGSKAANGVILITTSRASERATRIDLQMHGGLNFEPDMYPLMDNNSFKYFLSDQKISAGHHPDEVADMFYFQNSPGQESYYRVNNNTDWQKEVFNQSYTSNYGLKIQGGDDVAVYALSVGYLQQGGIVEESDYSRVNLRFNSDIDFSELFSLNSNIGFTYKDQEFSSTGFESPDDVVSQARIKAPFFYPYRRNTEGVVSAIMEDYDSLGVSNPVAILDNHQMKNQNYRFFGSFKFNFELNDQVTLSNLIGLSFDKDRESVFIPAYGVEPIESELGEITNKMKNRVVRHLALNNDLRVNYENRFGFQHGLKMAGGVRMNLNNNEEDWGQDYNSANDMIRTLGNGLSVLRQKGGYLGEWNNITYYLSGDYDYKRKYFLNLSMSLDGSSRFGEEADGLKMMGGVFGFFPSVSGAWLLTSEPFFAGVDFVDMLKLRAGYGITGNDDIGNYSSKKYYITQNLLSFQGLLPGNLHNPALKWETNTKINAALDFAVLRERVSASVEVYQNTTSDMIDFVPVTGLSGFENSLMNFGEFTTQGIDVGVNVQILNSPLMWDAGVTFSSYQTNVDKIFDDRKITQLYGANVLTEVGNPLGVFYGYKTDGVYATTAEAESAGLMTRLPNTELVDFQAGDVRFINSNPGVDNIIDENDMEIIGDPTPDFFGEFNTRLSWKNVTINAALAYSVGGDVYNYQRRQLESMTGFENQTRAVENRWQYEGQVTDVPAAIYGDPRGNSRFSDRWIEDGSYARLRNVTINYRLPIRPLGIQSLDVYASGNNLVTFTEYKGLDPEFSGGSYSLMQGIDLGLIPQTRSFIMGVKIGL